MKPGDKRKFNKGGRPKVNVDLDKARALLASGMSQLEVAKTLDVSWPTLQKRLKEDVAVQEPSPSAMDKGEYFKVMRTLGLKPKQVAICLGRKYSTVRNYTRTDADPIPPEAALALRLMVKFPSVVPMLLKEAA